MVGPLQVFRQLNQSSHAEFIGRVALRNLVRVDVYVCERVFYSHQERRAAGPKGNCICSQLVSPIAGIGTGGPERLKTSEEIGSLNPYAGAISGGFAKRCFDKSIETSFEISRKRRTGSRQKVMPEFVPKPRVFKKIDISNFGTPREAYDVNGKWIRLAPDEGKNGIGPLVAVNWNDLAW